MRTLEQQKEILRKALKKGIKTYKKAIRQQVGAYDQEEVTWILSQKDFETAWRGYCNSDTMVREYVMDIAE